jgi:hypothetical protein
MVKLITDHPEVERCIWEQQPLLPVARCAWRHCTVLATLLRTNAAAFWQGTLPVTACVAVSIEHSVEQCSPAKHPVCANAAQCVQSDPRLV